MEPGRARLSPWDSSLWMSSSTALVMGCDGLRRDARREKLSCANGGPGFGTLFYSYTASWRD